MATNLRTLLISLVTDLEYNISLLQCSGLNLSDSINKRRNLFLLKGLTAQLDYLVRLMDPNNNSTDLYVKKSQQILDNIKSIDESYTKHINVIKDLLTRKNYKEAYDKVGDLLNRVLGREPELPPLELIFSIIDKILYFEEDILSQDKRQKILCIKQNIINGDEQTAYNTTNELWWSIMEEWQRTLFTPSTLNDRRSSYRNIPKISSKQN